MKHYVIGRLKVKKNQSRQKFHVQNFRRNAAKGQSCARASCCSTAVWAIHAAKVQAVSLMFLCCACLFIFLLSKALTCTCTHISNLSFIGVTANLDQTSFLCRTVETTINSIFRSVAVVKSPYPPMINHTEYVFGQLRPDVVFLQLHFTCWNCQPCGPTLWTPENHKERVNQPNTVYHNSCPMFCPAT